MNARTSSPLRRSVIRASVDGFHNPRAVRYEGGRYSPEGYFENSYNYAALKQCFLDPLVLAVAGEGSWRGCGRPSSGRT
jgi:hypothetical protein